ncbi:hypothetical protein F5Y07DRAFT_112919 [Xylaria sp. FL0933]|nr:hypothetical protein F5Y07DRAFT_112919 [Xylaria sp. FL0933]
MAAPTLVPVDISTISTPTLPTRSTSSSDVSASCPRHTTGIPFCPLAKPTPPLSTGPLVSFPQVRHCMGVVGSGRGSVPIPPAGRRVPIDGRRGLSGIDLSPTSFYISARSPSTSSILYSSP